MPVRQLFDNFFSVMTFAVLGTIWNTLTIGGTLALFGYWGFYTVEGRSGKQLLVYLDLVNPEESFLFAALISAVDPVSGVKENCFILNIQVAVITVFEQIHVNEFLFIIVFGEALFNDGIAAVLFQIFKRVTLIGVPSVSGMHIFKFVWSFFGEETRKQTLHVILAVALGGALIGVIFAVICALATK